MTQNEQRIHDAMVAFGIYKPQFDQTIEICAKMMDQYDDLMRQLESGSIKLTERTDKGTKKSAHAFVIEALRKDILAYQKELGLTPASLKKMNDSAVKVQGGSGLADAIAKAMAMAGVDDSG